MLNSIGERGQRGRQQITALTVTDFLRWNSFFFSNFCQLVIISSKCILNSVGEGGQRLRIPLLISAILDS
jgi:hypothetical protein